MTATIEKLFDQHVTIADHYRLHVVREVEGEEERIVGNIGVDDPFGNWKAESKVGESPALDPHPDQVAKEVSVALGFEVVLANIDFTETDGRCAIHMEFERKGASDAPANPVLGGVLPQPANDSNADPSGGGNGLAAGGNPSLPGSPGDQGGLHAGGAPAANGHVNGDDMNKKLADLQARLDALSHHNSEIDMAEKVCQQCKKDWDDAEEEAEDAKKKAKAKEVEYDQSVNRLRSFVRGDDMPLFNQPKNGEKAKAPEYPADPKPVDDDSWRKVPMADLVDKDGKKLTESVVGKLHEAEVDTLGQWCDYLGQEYPPKITGIGKETRTKIDDCVDHFWVLHPRAPAEALCTPENAALIEKKIRDAGITDATVSADELPPAASGIPIEKEPSDGQ